LVDIKDAVDKADLPSEAEDPNVTEISSDNEMVFAAYLYADPASVPKDILYDHARKVVDSLEQLSTITTVDVSGSDEYEIWATVDQEQMKSMGLTTRSISDTIKAYNQNIPLGNFEIGDRQYDFRID